MSTVTPTMLQILEVIGTKEMTGRAVAKALKTTFKTTVGYATIYRTFGSLEALGLAKIRNGNDRDGPIRFITATRTGQYAVEVSKVQPGTVDPGEE
jgi:DNA-binding PadR family transcriptional regulator